MLTFSIIISYLIGSIPFGFIIGKIKGIDIRKHGSGNIGATNVWRSVGPIFGAIVLLLDTLKGITGVYLGKELGIEGIELITGLATLIGHAFPIFLGFKGGKIIATGLGVILALSPIVAFVAISVFGLVVFISHYVSLGSITAAISVPISMYFFHYNNQYLFFGLLVCIIATYKHIPNLKRIANGTENKISNQKRKD